VSPDPEVLQTYQTALNDFIDRMKKDSNIIAAILFGSLVSGNVWEESDIDIHLISKDESKPMRQYWIADGDIVIQVSIESRRHFRQAAERALGSSQLFHILATSKVLFSTDETLEQYMEEAKRIGNRDKQLSLLRLAMYIPAEFSKIRKSLKVYDDHIMAFSFLLHAIEMIARVDLVLHDQIPGREFMQQALELNPSLFNRVYLDLITKGIDRASVEEAFQLVTDYLQEKTPLVYQPILDFLQDEGGHCGCSRLESHFTKRLGFSTADTLVCACEWLANEGHIERMPAPILLTGRSRTQEMEAGYYYMGEDEL
jgi:hypothetical protein